MIMDDEKLREYQQQVAHILVRDYFPETDFQVDAPVITKNNNTKFYGITIKEKNNNIAPTYYTNDFLEEGYEPEAVALSLYENYNKKEKHDIQQYQIDQLKDFDKCKDKICYRIVNKQKNPEIEENCPTITIAPDLMMAFYIQVTPNDTCLIHNRFIEIWGLTDDVEKSLFTIADNNTEKLHPISFKSLTDLVRDIIPVDLWNEADLDNPYTVPMYVLTNDDHIHGASTILYRNGQQLKECLDELKMRYGVNDMYIIPSSIHEWILVPALPDITKEHLQSICQEVNQKQVPDTEFLSDNIFSFDENNGFQQITFTYRTMQQSR